MLFHNSRIGLLTPIECKHEKPLEKEMECTVEMLKKIKRFKECDKRNVSSKGYFGCCCYIWIETLLKKQSNDLKTTWVCINHLQIENKPLLKIQPDAAPSNFQLKVNWENFLYVHVWTTRNRLLN